MKPETAKALAELGRAAARHLGIPDNVVITMTLCPDREYEWCDLVDGEPDVDDEEEEFGQTVDFMELFP